MVDLNSLFDEIKGLIEPLVRNQVRLIIQLGPGTSPVAAARLSLKQILVHLVASAPEAMPRRARLLNDVAMPDMNGPELAEQASFFSLKAIFI